MALTFNLRHLDKQNLELTGDLTAEELDLMDVDDMLEIGAPVHYQLELERLTESILVRGELACTLNCRCVRCLRSFTQNLVLNDWTIDLPLKGDEKVEVNNDCVDLTPYVREDILLAFPQHPLCELDCRGLLDLGNRVKEPASVDKQAMGPPSAWSELNKLKF